MATATETLRNFIDGEFVDPADGETEPVLNPATGETIGHAPLSSGEELLPTTLVEAGEEF